jgi:hypothetical protein
MHFCKDCDYFASSNNNLKIHFKTKKHLRNTKQFKCVHCDKQYKYQNSLTKHITLCIKNPNLKNDNNINDCKLEIEKLKKEKENEINKIKHKGDLKIKLLKAKYKSMIASKNKEHKQIQINNQNNFKVSNIDIDTQIHHVLVPFILSHKCLKNYFEKSHTGLLDKISLFENIRRIITTTNDQMFNHHNKSMFYNDTQKKRIINKILKAYSFSQSSRNYTNRKEN